MPHEEPLQQPVEEPRGHEAPEKHGKKPQMAYTVGHTPKSDMETKTSRIETVEQEIYYSEQETRDEQPFKLLPYEGEERLPTCQFHTPMVAIPGQSSILKSAAGKIGSSAILWLI